MIFSAAHYAALLVFALGCWGLGTALLSRVPAPVRRDFWLEAAMAATLGIGVFICAFQALAIFGMLKLAWVIGLVALSVVAALLQLRASIDRWRAVDTLPAPSWSWFDKAALVALLLLAVPALVAPLAPPHVFDEMMYHLPYARQVAQSGTLGIHEWLRYPWFPYNYNLLYAGALLVGDDVLPHFLSALAGALSVGMVYRLGLQHLDRVSALAAAAIWLGLGDYASALIDMSVALFVLAACVALWWWRESPPERNARWLALAAFFLGVAAGSKYQALVFLPLVAVFVLWRERRVRVLAVALVCFLIPCIYWYARNAITTGDPFNPIGAKLFGFTNWNLADYQEQFYDVRIHAAWPNALIWPVLLAPFSAVARRSAAVRAALVFCAWSLLVWALTSRYPRYLMASFPLLALMSVVGWRVLFDGIMAAGHRLLPARSRNVWLRQTGRVMSMLVLALVAAVSLYQTGTRLAMISPTSATREAFLRKEVPGYAVMRYLREHATGRVYQVALSEAIYYGPNPIWGDSLGPWRYGDFIMLPPAELARKLGGLGFEAIVITSKLAPGLSGQPGFDDHFALMYEEDGAKAFRILKNTP